ncbi:MAG: DNA replication/repair protein RecF [Dehalococcoidia bacterium]|nr:MAG: DNA replication/repair protein RecF [Dehalococcoidia bacterium]
MYLARLTLNDLRTFRRLEVELTPGIHVITGANAQGKSNLLEAIAMLATTRSQRGGVDLDLISWDALAEDPIPAARMEAEVVTAAGREQLEVSIVGQVVAVGVPPQRAGRRFRVNGVARRASDLIGRLRVVFFAADDLSIIDGPPAHRRRYLDITLSQLDAAYVRALQRYARVLEQRNSLLKRLQERRGKPDELDFWDGELAEAGAVILAARAEALRALGRDAATTYAELAASESEALEVIYEPRVPPAVAARLREHDLAEQLLEALVAGRTEDVRRGLSLVGPHRDDVRFLIGGHAAGVSASRGQQRSAALALRLAEVAYSKARTGDAPVLLLDDILSELDPARRARVLAVAYGVDQVLITTPDEAHPSRTELPEATRWRLQHGQLVLSE